MICDIFERRKLDPLQIRGKPGVSLEIQVVIDRHGDTGACKPAAHTDITVHEPGPLDADIGTGRETQIQVADGAICRFAQLKPV